MEAESIAREFILDHYRHPRNKIGLLRKNLEARDSNPLCGDVVSIEAFVEDGILKEIGFQGDGCSISQAAASVLTEAAKGKPLNWVAGLEREKMLEMLLIKEIGPSRIKCALLAMKVLKLGTYDYLSRHQD